MSDMFDLNNDGKIDSFERAAEFDFMESLEETDSNVGYCGGRSSTSRGGMRAFKVTVGICVGFVLLAVLLGVEVSGAVIGFFLKIILVVGFFTLLGKLFT
mgnify:FL=1